MKRSAKVLLISMSAAFAGCILGLTLGTIYSLYESLVEHKELWVVLSRSILYYRILGGLGVLGFLFFLAFLFSLITHSSTKQTK